MLSSRWEPQFHPPKCTVTDVVRVNNRSGLGNRSLPEERPSLEELSRERYPSLEELLHDYSLEEQTSEGRPSLADLFRLMRLSLEEPSREGRSSIEELSRKSY